MRSLRRTFVSFVGPLPAVVAWCTPGLAVATAVTLAACERPAPIPPSDKPPAAALPSVPRGDFNRIAAELDLPLFWAADANGDGKADAPELAVLWGIDDTSWTDWVQNGALTPRAQRALGDIAQVAAKGHDLSRLPEAAQRQRRAVLAELAQGRPTLLLSDFSQGSAEDRAIVSHVVAAARLIEHIYAQQNAVDTLPARLPVDDAPSRMLFYRNQGPWCEAPKTENDEDCGAFVPRLPHQSGMYPLELQGDKDFCVKLDAHPRQRELLDPFVTVVKGADGELKAVPYAEAYRADMQAIATHLREAAAAITSAGEAPLKAYLEAAAQSFSTNDWLPADEAWAKMSVKNSKWYLRIGADETYFEPCSRKAGFHVSFARISQGSLVWQDKLDPHKNEMEAAIAALAGAPYKARQVSFHLPDFIEMVLNAGDSRSPTGATIGQSLPNWGPVANEGRGRTVAMTNLYKDDDSRAAYREQVASLLCPETMGQYSEDPDSDLLGTLLHEATHNLGPAHEYEVKGKKDDEIFGGPLASMFEELKAQSGALFLTDWLVEQKVIAPELAAHAHVRDLTWAFGHIAQGMYMADHKPRTYSHLSSIQIGTLMQSGAVEWRAKDPAANDKDTGCFVFHLDKMPVATKDLMKQVAGIKGRGDKAGAEALKAKFVDAEDEWSKLRAVIQERWLRAPKASFVYSIKL